MVGARSAVTEHPGLLEETVQLASDDISFKPGSGAGGVDDAGMPPVSNDT